MCFDHTQPLPQLSQDPSSLIYQLCLFFFFLTLSRPVCVAHYGCVVFHWDYTGENGLSSPWQLTVAISSMVGLYASSPLSSMLGFGLAWTCTGFVHGSATAPDSYTQ